MNAILVHVVVLTAILSNSDGTNTAATHKIVQCYEPPLGRESNFQLKPGAEIIFGDTKFSDHFTWCTCWNGPVLQGAERGLRFCAAKIGFRFTGNRHQALWMRGKYPHTDSECCSFRMASWIIFSVDISVLFLDAEDLRFVMKKIPLFCGLALSSSLEVLVVWAHKQQRSLLLHLRCT